AYPLHISVVVERRVSRSQGRNWHLHRTGTKRLQMDCKYQISLAGRILGGIWNWRWLNNVFDCGKRDPFATFRRVARWGSGFPTSARWGDIDAACCWIVAAGFCRLGWKYLGSEQR